MTDVLAARFVFKRLIFLSFCSDDVVSAIFDQPEDVDLGGRIYTIDKADSVRFNLPRYKWTASRILR